MSMETENLEHKAEQHRARVDTTLDELRGRLSVGQIVDEVWAQVRQGQGADTVKNLGRQVRDNPLALGLIGAGVAWLLAGDGVRAESRELKRRYDTWTDAHDHDEHAMDGRARMPYAPYVGARPPTAKFGSDLSGENRSASTPTSANRSGVGAKAKSAASNLKGDVSDAADRVGEAISGTAERAKDAAAEAGESIKGVAAAANESLRYYGGEASDTARFAVDEAGRYGRYARRDLYIRGKLLRRSFLDTLQKEPLIMGGLALAVGAAIGVSLPATRREDELLGPVRDDLRDSAYAYGEDVAERVGHVAEKAYDAASEEAVEKGLMPEGGKSETLAKKAGDVAKAATEAAKDEAKKEGLT